MRKKKEGRKRKTAAVAALILCAAILAECSGMPTAFGITAEAAGAKEMLQFSEIPYVRPDIGEIRERAAALEEALEAGCTLRKAEELLDRFYEKYRSFQTMYVLAQIRSDQNTRDEYYREEYNWCAESYYEVAQILEQIYRSCARSKLCDRLEDSYFGEGILSEYGEEAETAYYSEESIALMQRENALVTEYYELTANPVIELDGEERELNEYLEAADAYDTIRAIDAYYEQYNGRVAEVYIRLVKIRNEIAESLGFESYESMQYGAFGYDRDYSPQEAEELIEEIRRVIVPLYEELTPDWDSVPEAGRGMDEERLRETLSGAAHSMGEDIAEAFDFMEEFGLYDIEQRADKLALSYQSYLWDYEAPFLFVDVYGDLADVLSFAHEFGHYADAYINYDAYETMDLSECFSQGMEYLVLSRVGEPLTPDEREALYELKLYDTLDMYVQQASYAAFEHQVYGAEESELTAEYLNELALQLAKEFGYCDEYSETYFALGWIDITHFFEQPFYIISYPVSNDVAMQIFEKELEKSGSGLEKYMEMLPRDSEKLIEAAETVGLESPFAEGRMEKTAKTIAALLTA